MRKRLAGCAALGMAAVIALTNMMPAMAASWQQDSKGWRYQKDDGSYHTSSWQWLDSNKDGKDECYYFGADGYMASNGKTQDGYDVNADGQWTVDGVVQTKAQNPAQGQDQTQDQAQSQDGSVEVPEGSWVQGTGDKNYWRKWWRNEDGTYPVNTWVWLDDDGDGTAECYGFDPEGWVKSSGLTSDGYIVNIYGQWTVNGVVQTRKTVGGLRRITGPSVTSTGSNSSSTSSSSGSGYVSKKGYSYASDGNLDCMTSEQWAETKAAILDFKEDYITSDMSDFEKEMEIIKWITDNCSYESDSAIEYATAYGCIIQGEALCAGYADAFLQTAKLCGLKVKMSSSGKNNHVLNLIKLDGDWYWVDVTAADSGTDNTSGKTVNGCRCNRVNMTSKEMKAVWDAGNDWTTKYSCTATKYGTEAVYNYFKYGTTPDDVQEETTAADEGNGETQ